VLDLLLVVLFVLDDLLLEVADLLFPFLESLLHLLPHFLVVVIPLQVIPHALIPVLLLLVLVADDDLLDVTLVRVLLLELQQFQPHHVSFLPQALYLQALLFCGMFPFLQHLEHFNHLLFSFAHLLLVVFQLPTETLLLVL